MEQISRIVLKNKEITDGSLIKLILKCLVEIGGIQHVSRNLSELGYSDFSDTVYTQLDESKGTHTLDFSELSSNNFLVICIVIFATVKEVEDDTLILTSFDDGIKLLRNI